MVPRLLDLLRAQLPERDIPDELASVLVSCVADGAAAWPGVTVPEDRFLCAMAARLAVELPAERAIAALNTDDLYLACGCADGDPVALSAFEARYGPVIARAISATGVPVPERADLGQVVRHRMLVATGGRAPRIASYSARGTLAAWVRVVATREAARLRSRKCLPIANMDDELARRIAPEDPELAYMKQLYREEFKVAFRTAVDALDGRDRLVLRQHMLDGLSIEQLGSLHNVHRATAARWIASARDDVVAATRRALTRRLQLTATELDSVMRLIRSQLDISLFRLLGEAPHR
jgi:RNA polymerase sigma-70 factor, ECF subfamily